MENKQLESNHTESNHTESNHTESKTTDLSLDSNPWNFFRQKYVISLPYRTDRRIHADKELRRVGCDYKFFDAIKGNNRFVRDYVKHRGICVDTLSDGQIGCILSHFMVHEKCLLDIVDNENYWILIMEDDIKFANHFTRDILKKYVDSIPSDAQCIKFSYDTINHHKLEQFTRISDLWAKSSRTTYSMVCYALNTSILPALCKHRYICPIDVLLMGRTYVAINWMNDDLCTGDGVDTKPINKILAPGFSYLISHGICRQYKSKSDISLLS